MKKFILLIFVCFILSQVASAQAYEGKVEYQKKDEDAIVLDIPYPPSIVEGAIVDKLERMGHKSKESKGFQTYKAISISEISSGEMDYMIKVERKSRKDKDESVVYLVMKASESNPLSLSESNIKDNAKTFLNNLMPVVEAYNLEQEILAQEEALKKAEKKYSNLQDDLSDLEKRKKKLEDSINDNKKDQDKQRNEIDKQKDVLEKMKGKRKSI